MSFLFHVSNHISANLKFQDERVEQVLKEQDNMWKETNEDFLKRVELLSKEKAEKEEEHEAEIAEVIAEVKSNFSLAIIEDMIKLVEDMSNIGC